MLHMVLFIINQIPFIMLVATRLYIQVRLAAYGHGWQSCEAWKLNQ
jgi:hypothetical protein